MFTITGLKNGKAYTVRMDNLHLSGDPEMVALIMDAARVDHGLLGLQPSQESAGNYLTNECSAAHLAQLCFDQELSFTSDWYDDIPEDAVF